MASTFRRACSRLLPIDLGFAVFVVASWCALADVEELGGLLSLALIASLLRIGAWMLSLRALLGTGERERASVSSWSEPRLRERERSSALARPRFIAAYACAWAAYFLLVLALAPAITPLALGQVELAALGLELLALELCTSLLVQLVVQRALEPHRVELAAELARRGLERRTRPRSLARQHAAMVVGFTLAASAWLGAAAWLATGRAAREHARLEAHYTSELAARALSTGASTLERGAEWRVVPTTELPPALLAELPAERVAFTQASVLDRQRERASAATAIGDGRWVLVDVSVEQPRPAWWLGLLGVALIAGLVAPLAARGSKRALSTRLEQLRAGLSPTLDLAASPLVVPDADELGPLAADCEGLRDDLHRLLSALDAIAPAGDLEFGRVDDQAHPRFVAMVERLTEARGQVHAVAVEVASAAAEIDASARGQVQASRQQVDGVAEVNGAMQRLAQSMDQVIAISNEQLDNAEGARLQAANVAQRTESFDAAIASIAALLGQISEVAARSDLLALNGSLEATRAGEAGRGFALIAAEMRRLAERVSTTAAAVRETTAEVASTHSQTVSVTAASHTFAERTADLSAQIHSSSRTQAAETRLVSASVREIASFAETSVAASAQTRAAADALHVQAQVLEQLLRADASSTGTPDRD